MTSHTIPDHVLAVRAFRARVATHMEANRGRTQGRLEVPAWDPSEPPAHVLAARAFRARVAAHVARSAR